MLWRSCGGCCSHPVLSTPPAAQLLVDGQSFLHFAHRSLLLSWLWMTIQSCCCFFLCILHRLLLKMQAANESPVTSITTTPYTTVVTKSREQILIQSKGIPNLFVRLCAYLCAFTSLQYQYNLSLRIRSFPSEVLEML